MADLTDEMKEAMMIWIDFFMNKCYLFYPVTVCWGKLCVLFVSTHETQLSYTWKGQISKYSFIDR